MSTGRPLLIPSEAMCRKTKSEFNQVMRRGRGNAVTDIVVGILGALVGGFLARELFGVPNAVNGIDVGSIVVAFLGAIVAFAGFALGAVTALMSERAAMACTVAVEEAIP